VCKPLSWLTIQCTYFTCIQHNYLSYVCGYSSLRLSSFVILTSSLWPESITHSVSKFFGKWTRNHQCSLWSIQLAVYSVTSWAHSASKMKVFLPFLSEVHYNDHATLLSTSNELFLGAFLSLCKILECSLADCVVIFLTDRDRQRHIQNRKPLYPMFVVINFFATWNSELIFCHKHKSHMMQC